MTPNRDYLTTTNSEPNQGTASAAGDPKALGIGRNMDMSEGQMSPTSRARLPQAPPCMGATWDKLTHRAAADLGRPLPLTPCPNLVRTLSEPVRTCRSQVGGQT